MHKPITLRQIEDACLDAPLDDDEALEAYLEALEPDPDADHDDV